MKRITILLFLLYCNQLFCQDNEFMFSQINERNGLSFNVVNCFFKDSRNFLWIGTYDGLNRYDGANFYVYKKSKKPNSIINEVVHDLCEDRMGNLWGATDKGVFCFKPKDDSFLNYYMSSYQIAPYFYNILCDKNGDIWATGMWSIFKFNRLKNTFEELIKLSPSKDSLSAHHIRKNGFLLDPTRNAFWLTTSSGIVYYDVETKQLLDCSTQKNDSLFARRNTSALCQSPTGDFWFVNNSQKEIIGFNPISRKIVRRISVQKEMPNLNGATLFEDKHKMLWISSWSYDLLAMDLKLGTTTKIENTKGNQQSIAGNFFWSAFEDDDQTIWFGTVAGISKCISNKTIYRSFHLADKMEELKSTSLVIVEEDPLDQSLWLITANYLLFHYYPSNQKMERYDLQNAQPNKYGEKPGYLYGIRFMKDRLVIPSHTGIWQLKRNSKLIIPYTVKLNHLGDFKYRDMVIKGDSVIYLTDGQRLVYWNYKANTSILIQLPDSERQQQRDLNIVTMSTQGSKYLYVVLSDGRVAWVNEKYQLVPVKLVQNEHLEKGIFISMEVDSKGKVWAGIRSLGLYSYDKAKEKISIWDESDGLVSNLLHRIKVDKEDRIWTTCYSKFSVFWPSTNKFYAFQIPYSENNLNYKNWICTRQNGHVLVTVNNELFEINSKRLTEMPANNKPLLSQLMVNNINRPLMANQTISLNPNENTILFRFGMLTDSKLFPYDIEYKLEGAENHWTKASANAEALYNNLASGSYQFHLRAVGKTNGWQTEESVFNVIIKTPFYKSIWFITIVLLSAALGIFYLYRYRLLQKEAFFRLESKTQLLEKEKTLVMYENLKQQLNPHFLFNSLTSLSGLIQVDQNMAEAFLDQMSGIYRYILNNGDHETVSLKQEIDFVRLYIDLQQTRFKKGLIVNINIAKEDLHYKIAPVTLQNMMENAIKHNIIDSDSPLVIDIYIEGDYIVVRNNLQRKNKVETSNKKGLEQFKVLYHYLIDKPIIIDETNSQFYIKIPLI